MNNSYNNIPNNYGNNNFNNLNNNNDNNGNNENGSNVLFIGVIILLIVGAVFIILSLFGSTKAEKNLAEEQKKEPTVSENKKEEEQPQQPEQPLQNTENNQQNQQSQNNTNSQTQNKSSLKCTGTAKDEYGTYTYNHTYKFNSDSTMKSATLKTTVTLNKSYVNYRDSLIQSLKEENKKFVKLDGIGESVTKKSNGFTYTLTIDATKLTTKQLADMGYRTRNYTGVKMRAKEMGLKCS